VSVRDGVRKALGDRSDWQADAALALASAIDAGVGGASATKELRSLMAEIGGEVQQASGLDELKKRREKRGA
jgi:hypothetical protein